MRLENSELQIEVAKIINDSRYQKKLARDNLGVIAADEFLILFEQDLPDSSK